MEDSLKNIAELLLDEIYSSGNVSILDNPAIIELIGGLKLRTRLSLKFNVTHTLADHKMIYKLKNCDNDHCFECLLESIKNKSYQCDHFIDLTPYERHHIPWLGIKFEEDLNEA